MPRRFLQRLFGRPPTGMHAARLAVWRALRSPRPAGPVSACRCVVVDVETAGLDPRRDTLIAIGGVAVVAGRVRLDEHLDVVLRQSTVSAPTNILVHGIGGAAQRGGVEPAEALLRFLEFAGRDPLVAFHAMFDDTALRTALRRHFGLSWRAHWLDLAYLLPALFPEHGRIARTLDEWLQVFRIEVCSRHDAHADALATAQLLLIALERARRHGIGDFRSLHRLEKAQRYTRYQSAATG